MEVERNGKSGVFFLALFILKAVNVNSHFYLDHTAYVFHSALHTAAYWCHSMPKKKKKSKKVKKVKKKPLLQYSGKTIQ